MLVGAEGGGSEEEDVDGVDSEAAVARSLVLGLESRTEQYEPQ